MSDVNEGDQRATESSEVDVGAGLADELEALVGINDRERQRVDALQYIIELSYACGGTRADLADLARAYNARRATVEEWVYEAVPKLSVASIYRWRKAYERSGRAGLIAKWGNRSSHRYRSHWDEHPHQADYLIKLLIKHGVDLKAAWARARLRDQFLGQPIPSAKTVSRYLTRWARENPQLADRITRPDTWKGKHRVAVGKADAGVRTLNALWEIDTTPTDVLLRYRHPSGEERRRRYTVIAMVEVYSRMAAVKVIPSESSGAVVGFLKDVILAWRRFPEVIRTDQGAAYTSAVFGRALKDLGVLHELLPPGSPERKPFVERFLRTLNEDLLPTLPGFVGASVDARKAIEERAKRGVRGDDPVVDLDLGVEEFQEICQDWVYLYNHDHVHSALGCTPAQRVAAWNELGMSVRGFSEDEVPRYDAILGALLAPVAKNQGKPPGVRMVRKGVVRVDRIEYAAPELAGDWCGREVVCHHDESDLSRIYVFSPERTFICIAYGCDVPGGISRAEAARVAQRAQTTFLRNSTKKLRARARSINSKAAAQVLSERRARSTAPAPTVPVRGVSSEVLDEAEKAAEALLKGSARRTLPIKNDAAIAEAIQRERAQLASSPARPEFWLNAQERFEWCRNAIGRGDEGVLTSEDWTFVRAYEERLLGR